jgi:hypothetical protein
MQINDLINLIALVSQFAAPFEPFAQTTGRREAKDSSMAVGIVLRCPKPTVVIGNRARGLQPRKLSRTVINEAQFHQSVKDHIVYKP